MSATIISESESYKSLVEQVEALPGENCGLLIINLCSVLERRIQKNDRLLLLLQSKRKKDHTPPSPPPAVTIFHGIKAPNLSITQYIERILKYTRCAPSCFVIAQIYIDRYFHKKGGYLTSFNAHRLFITSLLVATKFHHHNNNNEYCCSNAYYAQVGGVSTEEMNKMELEFLFNIEFRLFVTPEVFLNYCQMLDN